MMHTPTIRLLREVDRPGRSGPTNGQYALQRALRRFGPTWLKVGGTLQPGEMPWIWCWRDGPRAAWLARRDRPFVLGPNVLFADSRQPCHQPYEQRLCHAASCRLLFTESAWYARLIARHLGPENRVPIVLWPYPIDPMPGNPRPARYDVLIYAKSGDTPALIAGLERAWPRTAVFRYGQFTRDELVEAARVSRACVYLSDDDRGPLALAEILASGCPTVGIERGAPFVESGQTGHRIAQLGTDACIEAVARCHRLDRDAVAEHARTMFDPRRIVRIIVEALDLVR